MGKCRFYNEKLDRCMNVHLSSVWRDHITLYISYEGCGDNCEYYEEG